jgi:hypothetical protein
MATYDCVICYRIYPGVSKTPFVHADDKYTLSELALASLKLSLGELRIKFVALLDNCPAKYRTMFERIMGEYDLEVIEYSTTAGNGATFAKQIEILTSSDCEFVYFAEDDYFYVPSAFPAMIEFMRQNPDADFATPYDHPDYYSEEFAEIHNKKQYIRVQQNHGKSVFNQLTEANNTQYQQSDTVPVLHWRTAQTTCLTFLARRKSLIQAKKVFMSFARRNYDGSIWLALNKSGVYNPVQILTALLTNINLFKIYAKAWYFTPWQCLFGKKYTLWSPMPTIATHAEQTGVAHARDWDSELERARTWLQEIPS